MTYPVRTHHEPSRTADLAVRNLRETVVRHLAACDSGRRPDAAQGPAAGVAVLESAVWLDSCGIEAEEAEESLTIITQHRDEPMPGMADRILNHLESSGIRAKQGVAKAEIEALSTEDLYSACPVSDLISSPPATRDWEMMRGLQNQLDQALDRKGMNEWAENICSRIKDGKAPKKQKFWRAAA